MEGIDTQGAASGGYMLDNAGSEASARFSALEALFDGSTIRHLQECGVAPGWNCLEIGAGGGSIARWLAERTGPDGHVLATDIDPRYLESLRHPNLELRRHDIRCDPLPESAFDLVHARLVLVHLPDRDRILARMAAALKPGGWLLAEEFDVASAPPDPAANPGEVKLRVQDAMTRLLGARGVHSGYGRLLPGRVRALGLSRVHSEGRLIMAGAGSPGVSLLRANYEQLRSTMIDGRYLSEREFAEDMERLAGPDFLMPLPILWSVRARREV